MVGITVDDVVKGLVKRGLSGVAILFCKETGRFYYDLNTQAKSHLHLYDDWTVDKRYGQSRKIEAWAREEIEDVLSLLFSEFQDCLYSRDYYNNDWMEVGVQLGLVEKQVKTTTIVSYI